MVEDDKGLDETRDVAYHEVLDEFDSTWYVRGLLFAKTFRSVGITVVTCFPYPYA